MIDNVVRGLILFLAVASVVCGVRAGEAEAVRQKAANVCLECIGIG